MLEARDYIMSVIRSKGRSPEEDGLFKIIGVTNEWIKENHELVLSNLREDQIQNFLQLGIHERLGMSKEEYAESFPRFTDRPFPLRWERTPLNAKPFLVEPRLPFWEMYDLLNISPKSTEFTTEKRKELEERFQGGEKRSNPYILWDDESYTPNLIDRKAQGFLKDLQVATSLESGKRSPQIISGLEALAWVVNYPERLLRNYLSIGMRYLSDGVDKYGYGYRIRLNHETGEKELQIHEQHYEVSGQ